MAYKRVIFLDQTPTQEQLTSDLVAIGLRLAAKPSTNLPNIEDTLFLASRDGIAHQDFRTLGLLVDWFSIHGERVNADRFIQLILGVSDPFFLAFWGAVVGLHRADPRFKKLRNLKPSEPLNLLPSGSDFLMARHGEDPRFKGSGLRVPKHLLRHRPEDILSPSELAKKNRTYFYRVLIGATYRADMVAQLELHPGHTPTTLAKATYGSFATAWTVLRDWNLLKPDAR